MGGSFESVLSSAQAGSEWAFAELYDSYNPLLERYFAARAPSASEDLASETWMGAARALAKFRGDEVQFRSWLFTIAHRRLVDYWKARKQRGSDRADNESLDYPAPDDTEAAVLDSLSGQAAARKIAASLPPEQAEVVLLRVVAGLGVEEVAKIMGRRPGSVRVLQHRALKKLSRAFSLEPVTE